jgi:hypothetical protein
MSEPPEPFGYRWIICSYHSPFTGGDYFPRMETETGNVAVAADLCIFIC